MAQKTERIMFRGMQHFHIYATESILAEFRREKGVLHARQGVIYCLVEKGGCRNGRYLFVTLFKFLLCKLLRLVQTD